MNFHQIRDFVNPAVAQATGLQEVDNLQMPVPVAYVPVQIVIDGSLSLTSENPVQNKVIAVAIQNLDGRITAIEGQFSAGVTEAVNNWLAAHPEATTTVQDGAITYAKLDANLKGEVDQISDLKSALGDMTEIDDGGNLINPSTLVVGRMNADGTIQDLSSYRTSDYILIEAGSYVLGRINTGTNELMAPDYCGYGLYNLDKSFIANSRVYQQYTEATIIPITITEKCYIRVIGNRSYFEGYTLNTGYYMLCKGTTLEAWRAYREPKVYSTIVSKDVDDVLRLVPGKNLYDKESCNSADGYYYNTSTGVRASGANYATSGKIPVNPNTKYAFSAGTAAIVRVNFYKGDGGYTQNGSTTSIENGFTTPEDCTYIGVTLFGTEHTTTDFANAIAAAQLEEGDTVTAYESYQEHRVYAVDATPDDTGKALTVDKVQNGKVMAWALKADAKDFIINASPVNIFDKTIAEDGKYFNTSYHRIYSSENYSFSGLIPVKPNTQYNYSIQRGLEAGAIGAYYQEWGADKSFIDDPTGNQSTAFLNQVQTGADTYYISFNITYTGSHTTEQFQALIDTLMVVEGTQRPAEYVAYNEETLIDHLKLDDMYHRNDDRWHGKKWLATGTSVTYQDSKYYTEGVAKGEIVNGYVGDVARRKPMLVKNVAVSGSTLAGSDTRSLINRYQSLNFAEYDFITIEYGINDFGNNVPVGTAQDAAGTDTFAACLKTIIEYALNQNPIVGLIICTDPDVRGSTTNQNGNTLKDYADVMLDIAKQYRLPVCDWFYRSGINSITKGDGSSRYFLTQSGTHPSVYGHMRMGAMLNQVFDSLLC